MDSIYTFNEVGRVVWGLLNGKANISQIIDTISGEYEFTREETEADFVELIGSMEAAGLIS